jgi:radical SAM peptide maturase (CXXX-repeat target family)
MQKTITFIVTSGCTRSCAYCYVVRKGDAVMSFETARAAIDCLLSDPRMCEGTSGLVVDFIGGEALLQAPLIEQIMSYITAEAFRREHPWFDKMMFSISSNGDLYLQPQVQSLVRWRRMEITLTIDGPEDVHDGQRGRGSYATLMQAFRVWREQYPHLGTKVTLVPETLPHLARSVMHLLQDLRLPAVHANPVFEDVWRPEHAPIFEEQLMQLAQQMRDAGMPLGRCSVFSPWIGKRAIEDKNWCGCGTHMLAVDYDGRFFPCFRFSPITLMRPTTITCGSIATGVDWGIIERFQRLKASDKSPEKCRTCEVSGGCSWCTGYDYDRGGTILHRETNICELHIARVRAHRRLRDAGYSFDGGSNSDTGRDRRDRGALQTQASPPGAGHSHESHEPAGGSRHLRTCGS